MIIPRSPMENETARYRCIRKYVDASAKAFASVGECCTFEQGESNSPFDGRLKQPYQSALVGTIPLLSVRSGHNFNTI